MVIGTFLQDSGGKLKLSFYGLRGSLNFFLLLILKYVYKENFFKYLIHFFKKIKMFKTKLGD